MHEDPQLIAFINRPARFKPSDQERLFKEINRRIQTQIVRFHQTIARSDLLSDPDFRQELTDRVVDRIFLTERRERTEPAGLDRFLFLVVRSVAVDLHRRRTTKRRAGEEEGRRRTCLLDETVPAPIQALWEEFNRDEEVQLGIAREVLQEFDEFLAKLPRNWRLILRVFAMWGDPLTDEETHEIAALRGVSPDQIREELTAIDAQLDSIAEKNSKVMAGLEDDFALERRYERRLQELADGEPDRVRAEVAGKLEKTRARRQAKLRRGWSAVEPSAVAVMDLIGAEEVSSVANIRTILSRARKKIRRHFAERCHELVLAAYI
jgi:DNA-directed RNA polymerase specialized sigma24 family protein